MTKSIDHHEVQIESTGAIVCWRTSSADRVALREAMIALGPKFAALVPERDTPLRSAKRAIRRWADSQNRYHGRDDVLVRTASKAVNLVREYKDESNKNRYQVLASMVLPSGRGDIDPSLFAEVPADRFFDVSAECGEFTEPPAALVQIYREERKSICAAALGQVCRFGTHDLIEAVRVRPEGGVFWCPEHRIAKLRKFADAIEASSNGARVYILRTVADDNTIRAIGDALESEVAQLGSEVDGFIGGDEEEGVEGRDAPKRYTKKVEAAKAKLERYKSELNNQFERVESLVLDVDKSLDQTSLIEDAVDAFSGI